MFLKIFANSDLVQSLVFCYQMGHKFDSSLLHVEFLLENLCVSTVATVEICNAKVYIKSMDTSELHIHHLCSENHHAFDSS